MATFVIVHGGWGGGWEWTAVARLLRAKGHDVFTPTLTGLGDRAHLGAGTRLTDHIEDVLATLRFEDLRDIVLCGQSYGGMVITGAADRAAERIRLLAYLDAFVPADGESLFDLVPVDFRDAQMTAADERGDARTPYPAELHPPTGLIPEERRATYIARMRPHPVGTLSEPVRLSGAVESLRRVFVRCTDPGEEIIEPFAARARAAGWPYREIPTAHDLQLLAPDLTAAVLDELAELAAS